MKNPPAGNPRWKNRRMTVSLLVHSLHFAAVPGSLCGRKPPEKSITLAASRQNTGPPEATERAGTFSGPPGQVHRRSKISDPRASIFNEGADLMTLRTPARAALF